MKSDLSALINIDAAHQRVHNGDFFTVSKRTTGIADNGFAYLRIKTGANHCHFSFAVTTTGKAYVDTQIGNTYSADGTAITPTNRNTTSGFAAPTTLFYSGPTVNQAGTTRFEDIVPGGDHVQSRVGSVGSYAVETKLAPSQDILIAVQNKAGAAIDVAIVVNFYETTGYRRMKDERY